MTPAQWRLILTEPASGDWNMAVDETLLEAVGRGESLPTLRLYAWQPACLSIGYAQAIHDVDRTALERAGWDLVRRPTGGRAILHTDECTYAVIAPLHDPRIAGRVLTSYSRIAQALLQAVQQLGLPAHADEEYPLSSPGVPHGPVCFETPSSYEITIDGKKLIGSAQARRKDAILQHGTFPLSGDLTRITRVLKFPNAAERNQAAEHLLEQAATAEILGQPVTWNRAASAIIQAFCRVLDVQFQIQALSRLEQRRVTEWMVQKYASAAWTERI
jgi:lipoate-protein ligase A